MSCYGDFSDVYIKSSNCALIPNQRILETWNVSLEGCSQILKIKRIQNVVQFTVKKKTLKTVNRI